MFVLRKKSEMRTLSRMDIKNLITIQQINPCEGWMDGGNKVVTWKVAGRISVSLTPDGERGTGKDAYAT